MEVSFSLYKCKRLKQINFSSADKEAVESGVFMV